MRKRLRSWLDTWVDLFARHELLTYASAIAFRAFVALLALVLLGFALLGATGHESVWSGHMAPAVERKLTAASFLAVDDAVRRIMSSSTGALIALASVLALWEVSSAVRACMGGLNRIYETDETRPFWTRFAISFGLALGLVVAIFGSFALGFVVQQLGHGAVYWLLAVLRWIAVVLLLWGGVTLLVRFAPAERRAKKWVSAGGALIVVAWIVTSVVFGLFVARIADFRTAEGNLAVFFVLCSYIYTGAITFLVGEQLDELARSKT